MKVQKYWKIVTYMSGFGKLAYILKNPKAPTNLKRKTLVLFLVTLTTKSSDRLGIAQRAMERKNSQKLNGDRPDMWRDRMARDRLGNHYTGDYASPKEALDVLQSD